MPSTTASTSSSRAICGSGFLAPLYCITEVREITRRVAILAQVGDQGIGQAVGKVFLLGVAGKVFERQHGDGFDVRHLYGRTAVHPYVSGQAAAQARHVQTDEHREQRDERADHRGHKPALL